ncbi:MAG: M15 family metallopeptidase, partial [bacterium]
DRDELKLHPFVREAAWETLHACISCGLSFRIFEGFRSQARQTALFAQGRTTPGNIVTYAKAGNSYHQYGLAVDVVGWVSGQWTWDRPQSEWMTLHAIARSYGLEPLNFETPHLQMAGQKLSALISGYYPAGGDDTWLAALKADGASIRDAPPGVPRLAPKPEVIAAFDPDNSADALNAAQLDKL